MKNKFIATPTKTKEILSTFNFSFKKSLGQNFLIDVNILKNMIQYAGIHEQSGVIEIGPGIGSLTEQLALHADQVLAIEIDQRLIKILSEVLKDYDNINIIHADVLKIDLQKEIKKNFTQDQQIQVIANLPYYITTPIIMKLLSDRLPIDRITIMVQKEVADRMIAQPNHKDFSSLSIAVQYFTEPEIIMEVPQSVFLPQPNVQSAVLKMDVRSTPPVEVMDEEKFFQIVRASFTHRRKTIRNNLIHFFKKQMTSKELDECFLQSQIDGSRRGESLSIEEFAALTDVIMKYIHSTEK